MKRKPNDLSFKLIEIYAPEASLDDLLDFVADLLVKKWMEEKNKESGNFRRIHDRQT